MSPRTRVPVVPPLTVDAIAKVCHKVNRTYCLTLGDASQPPWELAPAWQKASARAGVVHILANPDTTPEQSHAGWLAQKAAEGWTYGPEKDVERKQHPCFRPYAELPPEQRYKDHLFLTVVKALTEDAPDAAR